MTYETLETARKQCLKLEHDLAEARALSSNHERECVVLENEVCVLERRIYDQHKQIICLDLLDSSVYVCMCVCKCVFVCVYVMSCLCVCVCVFVWFGVCNVDCIGMCICKCYVYICRRGSISVWPYGRVCAYVCMYMCLCVCECFCVCVYVRICE